MMQKPHPEEGLIHIGPARNVNLNGKSMSQQPSPLLSATVPIIPRSPGFQRFQPQRLGSAAMSVI
jgi:hypothetical protein